MTSSALRSAVSIREIPGAPDVLALYEQMRGEGHPWLLESALRRAGIGRHSFLGSDPYLVLRAHGSRVQLESRRDVRPDLPGGSREIEGDPLEIARSLLPPAPPPSDGPPFVGGAVGCWGYELGELTEPVRLTTSDELGLPDLMLCYVDRLIALDHVLGCCYAVGLGFGLEAGTAQRAADEARDDMASCALGARQAADLPEAEAGCREVLETALPADLRQGLDAEGHARAVREIQRDIEAGNVYQANLTQRMERPYGGDALDLYRVLRRLNPAPFAALLEGPEFAVVSSSPERYLRVDSGGFVESRPIKGTRPRGRTPREDACMAAALARSEKDRAENLMIVDLVRNDLGRVCETGSVEVPELMAIEAYASVFQMVSTVTGRLAKGRDATDLLRATFPPGSMTGAPKIAAMRIIDREESVRRGVYSGAIGYLDVRGGADLSVVIRTILLKDGMAFLHAGGGIVADSDPKAEHLECLDKVRALLAALELASRPAAEPEALW